MKPPPPTTNNPLGNEEEAVAHRAAMIPMVLGLLAIGAFAVFTIWDDVLPRKVRKVTTGQMQLTYNMGYDNEMENGHGNLTDLMPRLLPVNGVDNYMLVRQNDQVLISEPANLPAPNNGQRICGFARTDGHISEQYAMWKIKGKSVEQIQKDYADAAISMGFSKLNNQSKDASQPHSDVYVRSPQIPEGQQLAPPAEQVLIVRTKSEGQSNTKLMLWYRYPISFDMP